MKAGWESKTLGEVLEKTETVNPLQSPETEFDYIDVSSVSNTTFQIEQTQRLKGKDAPSRARKLVKTDDVIFATIRPTLRRIAIVPPHLDKQVCSTGYFVLRPKPNLNHRFVYYWLFAEEFMGQMEVLQKGASYPAVTDKEIRDQVIPFPSLPEQQRIVTLLDEAFDGIATARAHAEKNLQNARAIFESHLQSVFTNQGTDWKCLPFEKAVDSACTMSYGIVQPGEEYPDGLPIVRPTDLGGKIIEIEGLKRIDPTLANSYRRTTLRGGDILLCVRGTTGQISVASAELAGANVTRGIVPIFFERTLVAQDFGYYLMRSDFFQSQIRDKTYGTALQQINIGDLRNLTLPIPPLFQQEALTSKFDDLGAETQRLESLYQHKLRALDEFKKSLLAQAFSGAL